MKKDKNSIYIFSNIYDIFISEEKNLKFNEISIENINSENKIQDELSKFYEEDVHYLFLNLLKKI